MLFYSLPQSEKAHARICLYCILILLLTAVSAFSSGNFLPVITTVDVLTDYKKFIGSRGPVEITDYSGEYSRRDVVEIVLLQQALARGGLDFEIVFTTGSTYLRTIEEVIAGRAAVTASTAWLIDMVQNRSYLAQSPALIRDGEFQVGIYTSPANLRMLGLRDSGDIKNFAAVSNKNWRADWRTLEALGVYRLIHVQKWKSMVRMVDAGRADFLLAPFQHSPGMLIRVDKKILAPVFGKKVVIRGSRHFAISKRHPRSQDIQEALKRGLGEMRNEGAILTAYRDAGFFHPDVQNWKAMNLPEGGAEGENVSGQ